MHTVISAFSDAAEARRAIDRLVERGISRDQVHLEEGRQPSITHAGSDTAQSDDGFFDGISRFFSELFGADPDEAAHATRYAEAVRRGGTVVVVDAIDAKQAERARETLEAIGGTLDMASHADATAPDDERDLRPVASGRADNLSDDDAFARTDTNTRDGGLGRGTVARPAGRSGALAGTDASTRLESDTGTLPGTDTNTRIDLDQGGSIAPGVDVPPDARPGQARVFQRAHAGPVSEIARRREQTPAPDRRGTDEADDESVPNPS